MFVNQSLLASNRALTDEEEQERIQGTATIFFIFAIVGFVFFGILVVLRALFELNLMPEIKKAEFGFGLLTLIFSIISILWAIQAQRCYKLKARI